MRTGTLTGWFNSGSRNIHRLSSLGSIETVQNSQENDGNRVDLVSLFPDSTESVKHYKSFLVLNIILKPYQTCAISWVF